MVIVVVDLGVWGGLSLFGDYYCFFGGMDFGVGIVIDCLFD